MFSCEFCEISKNTFLTEHLRATVLADVSTVSVFIETLEAVVSRQTINIKPVLDVNQNLQ